MNELTIDIGYLETSQNDVELTDEQETLIRTKMSEIFHKYGYEALNYISIKAYKMWDDENKFYYSFIPNAGYAFHDYNGYNPYLLTGNHRESGSDNEIVFINSVWNPIFLYDGVDLS